jgi:hypothetical protein
MPDSRDLTSSTGEVFLCPPYPSLPLSCAAVTGTALMSSSRYPPESSIDAVVALARGDAWARNRQQPRHCLLTSSKTNKRY